MTKPLRAVLLYSSGHLGSTIVFNILHNSPEIEVVGVMRADAIPRSKKGKSQFWRYVKKLGFHFTWLLAWQVIVQRTVLMLARFVPAWKDSALIASEVLAKRMGIPSFKLSNINDPRAATFIKSIQPDLIISAYFSQIIEPHILSIPKIGAINIHPGWLPSYRGALSYFWALKNDEKKAGVSIHWMDAGLDTGGIIDRKKFSIDEGATQQQVMVETALIAARMIQRCARKIMLGRPICPIDVSAETEHYYSMPTGEDFSAYFKTHGYFRIRDIMRLSRHGIKHRRLRKKRKLVL